MFKKNLIKALPAVILSSLLVSVIVYAWREPEVAPPGGNLPPPLHQGSAIQTKTGGLNLMGNVGIGTTGPTTRLDVDGQIRIRGGSPAAGRVLTSAADGTATWTVPAGGLPTGTVSQTLRHDGTNWVANSNIFNTGTNVGIGTTGPTTRLDVDGQIRIRGGSPAAGRVLTSAADGTATWTVPAGGLPTGIASQTLRHDGTNWVANSNIFNTGTNVGIGTTSPMARFDIHGVGGLVTGTGNIDPAGGFNLVPLQNSGKLLIGWNRRSGPGEIDFISNRASGNEGGFSFFDYTNAGVLNHLVTMRGDGNVGIGTTAPGARLDVVGPVTGAGPTIRAGGGGDVVLASGGSLFFDGNYSYATGNYIRPLAVNTQAFFTSGLERMRITSGGNIGIGTTTPGQRLQVGASGDGTSAVANAWNVFSDARLKTNTMSLTNVLPKLNNINAVRFNWKNDINKKDQIGFIAQEVEEVFPELVFTDIDGYKSVDYSKFSAVLVSAIKELKMENEQLKSRLEILENR